MVRKSESAHRLPTDPTPAEIRRFTEAIRESWSPHELTRRAGLKPINWMPPMLNANDWPDFSSDFDPAT